MVLSYYQQHNSNVFAFFFDASKATDRVNHWKLFNKLILRGMPLLFVRLLAFLFSSQELCVIWGSVLSGYFKSSNNVRQGYILSPVLFNFFMDDLSVRL